MICCQVFSFMDRDGSGTVDLAEFENHIDNIKAFSDNVELNAEDMLIY